MFQVTRENNGAHNSNSFASNKYVFLAPVIKSLMRQS